MVCTLFEKGDLVKIRTWRARGRDKVGVVVRPVKISHLNSDFDRYEILIEKKILQVRGDMLLKVKDK